MESETRSFWDIVSSVTIEINTLPMSACTKRLQFSLNSGLENALKNLHYPSQATDYEFDGSSMSAAGLQPTFYQFLYLA